MDGENWSFIKTLQRDFESALELFSIGHSFNDRLDKRQTLLRQRVGNCIPNAATQFRGRQLRISSYQDLLNRDPLLRQQTQDDGGDRSCFSRTRARLDDGEPLFERRLCGLEFRFHRRMRAAKIGSKTERLISSHSLSSTLCRLRNTSLM